MNHYWGRWSGAVLLAALLMFSSSNWANTGTDLMDTYVRFTAVEQYEGVTVTCTILTDELLDAWEAYEGYADLGDRIQALSVMIEEEQYLVYFVTVRPGYRYGVDFAPLMQNVAFVVMSEGEGQIPPMHVSYALDRVLEGPKSTDDVQPLYYGIFVFQSEDARLPFQHFSMTGTITKHDRLFNNVEWENEHTFRFPFMLHGVPPENRMIRFPGTLDEVTSYLQTALTGWP